jgi:callose synthase
MAGYLVLVYQSVYYHWAFRSDVLAPGGMPIRSEECNFWWWQYVWLSLVASSVYFLESFLCWMPSVVSALMTWNNDIVQALLNICYPTSQLYVGKKIDVPFREVAVYISYWLSLITFKLWFGYRYVVNPVTIPSLQLYDDYMNFQNLPFLKTSTLMFVWWFPHFLVYLIDLSIWYSCWSSIVGGFVALVDRQGAVRDSTSFRAHFMRSPMAFCQKIMAVTSQVGARSSIGVFPSTASLAGLMAVGKPTASVVPSTKDKNPKEKVTGVSLAPNGKMPKKAMSSADLRNILFSPAESSSSPAANLADDGGNNGWSEYGDGSSYQNSTGAAAPRSADSVTEFLDVRSQRWVIFGRVWNEIICKLRDTDHLSDAEKEILLFSTFDWFSKPIYLPLFQTAGCVETSIYALKEAASSYLEEKEPQKKLLVLETFNNALDVTTKEAVAELWELLGWVFQKLLGSVHQVDVGTLLRVIGQWAGSDDIFSRINADGITTIAALAAGIVSSLKGCIGKRKKTPVVTPDVLQRSNDAAKNSSNAQTNGHSPSNIAAAKGLGVSGLKKIKKSVSTGFLSALEGGESTRESSDFSSSDSSRPQDAAATTTRKYAKLQPFRHADVFTDGVRDKVREDVRNMLHGLRNLLKVKIGVSPEGQDLIDRVTFILSMESGFLWNDVYASMQIDELARDMRAPSVLNKANGLLRLRQTQVDPASSEANRRLNFFVNSLFMDMPNVPSSRWAREYTCMTPYYSEDVLLTKADLESKNSDGVSTILYLQTLYKKDWLNFLERRGLSDDMLVWSSRHLQETRMWASLRAQTLFRTVDGMMHSEAAVRLLAELEQTSAPEIETLAKLKFNYVVACQVYGQMRKNLEHKADDIEFLMARHANLRVAYIDSIRTNRDGDISYYSVLIKHDPYLVRSGDGSKGLSVKEVYRVKLPGNPVLGEGKPENQNHAIIFSRGRYLQAIDMNQDGYFEESLKMRNLLQEFDSGCSILGFREHIFTGSVSSVANYMALQELSFVSLGQRVLAQPLRIRQHYGHPDLFDKFFVMTEGGMSKASHGINLSEDVFAGFNATIRGHTVNFKEYVQVGKGRDVGLQQTYKFEAKLSQGNAEQTLSRDMYRICDRLDFFRLMSFYYGGIGHYIANTMVMFTLVVVVYTCVGLAIYGEEGVNGRPMQPEGVLQLLLSGMGLLQTMPLIVTLSVEKGFLNAMSEIAWMFLSGGPLYFIFHIQTKCYYFQQTLLAGGAKYRPTGRGFVIRHSPFDENFRFFASSHIYLGYEIMVALILFSLYTSTTQYWGITWSLWLTCVSFILGPFWFNPVTFEWNKMQEDYVQWIRWMMESGGTAEQSWEVWWKEENSFFKGLSLSWKSLLVVQKCCLWLFIGAGLAGSRLFRDSGEQQKVLELFVLYGVFFFGNWCISKLERSFTYAVRRFASLALSTVVVGLTIYLFVSHTLYIRYTVAIYYVISSIAFLCLLVGFTPVAYMYKMHDYLVGHTIFSLIGILSAIQVPILLCSVLLTTSPRPLITLPVSLSPSLYPPPRLMRPSDRIPSDMAAVPQRSVLRSSHRRHPQTC